MTKELTEELFTAIKEDCLYDFIANNYTRLSQYELARIAMDLYLVGFVYNRKPTDKIKKILIDGLREEFEDDDD